MPRVKSHSIEGLLSPKRRSRDLGSGWTQTSRPGHPRALARAATSRHPPLASSVEGAKSLRLVRLSRTATAAEAAVYAGSDGRVVPLDGAHLAVTSHAAPDSTTGSNSRVSLSGTHSTSAVFSHSDLYLYLSRVDAAVITHGMMSWIHTRSGLGGLDALRDAVAAMLTHGHCPLLDRTMAASGALVLADVFGWGYSRYGVVLRHCVSNASVRPRLPVPGCRSGFRPSCRLFE